MARPDFRGQAAQRLSEEREELSPAIISLLGNDSRQAVDGHPQRTRRSHRRQSQPAAPDVRRGHPDGAGGVHHGARRAAADPGPARHRRAGTSSSPASVAGARPRSPGLRQIRRHHRGHRRRHRARDRHHREPPAGGPLAPRRGADVRAHDDRAWLQPAQAGPEAGQGQGLHREPAAPRGRARPRSSSWCLCAKTPCPMPTSCSRSTIPGSAGSWPSRSPVAS